MKTAWIVFAGFLLGALLAVCNHDPCLRWEPFEIHGAHARKCVERFSDHSENRPVPKLTP